MCKARRKNATKSLANAMGDVLFHVYYRPKTLEVNSKVINICSKKCTDFFNSQQFKVLACSQRQSLSH